MEHREERVWKLLLEHSGTTRRYQSTAQAIFEAAVGSALRSIEQATQWHRSQGLARLKPQRRSFRTV
jgi:hypothetical protein